MTFDECFAKATGTNAELFNTLLAVLTAVTVVLGMRMMGALLISSLIIFPALSAMRVCRSFRSVTICAAVVSVVCFMLGLCASYLLDTPTGASVVVANVVADEKIAKFLEKNGGNIVKTIVVKNKLVNLIVK